MYNSEDVFREYHYKIKHTLDFKWEVCVDMLAKDFCFCDICSKETVPRSCSLFRLRFCRSRLCWHVISKRKDSQLSKSQISSGGFFLSFFPFLAVMSFDISHANWSMIWCFCDFGDLLFRVTSFDLKSEHHKNTTSLRFATSICVILLQNNPSHSCSTL